MLEVQSGLNFAAIFISIIIVAILDIRMTRQYRQYYDEYDILPKASAYSVLVKGLPKDITVSEITQFLTQKIYEQSPQLSTSPASSSPALINKIYLIYNLKTYYSLYSNKRSMLEELLVLEHRKWDLQQKLESLDGNQPLAERTKLTRMKKENL